MKMRLAVTLVVIFALALLYTTMTPPGKNLEVRFKGKIEKIADIAQVDGESYMVVDGKKIIFNSPMWQAGPFGPIDPAINLSGDMEGKKYIGKTVEVYAIKDIETKTLSLRGVSNKGTPDFYIKLLDRTFKDSKVSGTIQWAGFDEIGIGSRRWQDLGYMILTDGTKIIYEDPTIFAVSPKGTLKGKPEKGKTVEAFVTKVEGESYWRDNKPTYTLYGKKSYNIQVTN